MSNASIFQSVDGQSFIEAFSETGTHYPGAPALRVPNPGFDPALPPDPETNPPAFEAYVLMTDPSPDADPIRFVFVFTCEIYLSLCRHALCTRNTTGNNVTFTRYGTEKNGAEHRGHCKYTGALIGINRSRNMSLRDVRNFVCQHSCKIRYWYEFFLY